MTETRRNITLGAVLALATALSPAWAADYPTRPIELVVPSSAGGGTDVMARNFADAARKYLPQPFVVTNKPGVSGGLAMGEVQRAAPDGYKVVVLISELAIIPHLGMVKFGVQDFIPIARLNADPGTITVRADAPWHTVEEFLAHARKNPGAVAMGNAGSGSIWHLAAAAVEQKTGVRFNHVPFQGAAPSVVALLGGHVDAIAVSPAEIGPHVASGKLKVLGVMAEQRLGGQYANVPTFKEQGVDLALGTWRGLGVPLGTPPEVVAVLRETTRKAVAEPAFKDAMAKTNLIVSYMDGEPFKAFMADQSAYFKKLLTTVTITK
ncbi:Bug family tripartite tricarboxylate transporter substrate binding protein [Azohydromonas lata]|uniref:Bug family tripartite tricarboxylate transporter substrate binding protein n=1 Tax=Azohydromonas lata TaxID=45677 RepID=UPI0008333D60|nr:tripartite tricarboxylate transporter substrate binding protein [Azohydromonas lata]